MTLRPLLVFNGMGVAPRLWRRLYFDRLRACGVVPQLAAYERAWLGDAPSIAALADRCLQELAPQLASAPILVGFSAGALVAQEIAARAGDALGGLVLISPFAQPLALQRCALDAEHDAMARGLHTDLLALLDVLQMCSRDELFDDRIFSQRLAAMRKRDRTEPLEAALFAAVHRYTIARAALERITCPTQVIAFEDDLMVPALASLRVAAAVPSAGYASIPHAGHAGLLSHQASVAQHLEDFLRRVSTVDATPAAASRAERSGGPGLDRQV